MSAFPTFVGNGIMAEDWILRSTKRLLFGYTKSPDNLMTSIAWKSPVLTLLITSMLPAVLLSGWLRGLVLFRGWQPSIADFQHS